MDDKDFNVDGDEIIHFDFSLIFFCKKRKLFFLILIEKNYYFLAYVLRKNERRF